MSTSPTEARPAPLQGIRVLDLTRLLPGPLSTQHLADMGAEVIKIEDTGAGDYARTLGPRVAKTTGLFLLVNRNKRSLRLDLKQPQGREVLLELATQADVLVEGFRPGVMERLGLGYKDLKAVNPALVYCAISGYGQFGPYRERAGHDLNYCALTGILDQTGPGGGPPAISNLQIGDLLGGAQSAVMGILAALLDARLRGEGRYLDVAMADCALAHNILPLAAWLAGGETRPRGEDLLTGALPCYGVYKTLDGRYMAVGALEAKFWRLCCQTLGRSDLIERHWVFSQEAEQVREELAAIFRTQPQAHWIELFEPVDCCVTPVLTLEEAMAHPQFRAREIFVRHNHPTDGEIVQYGFPVKFSDFEFQVERPAPALGEHSEAILRESGLSAERIADLRSQGVI